MFEGKDRNPPHIVTPLGQVPAGLANIRLGWKFQAVKNTPAYTTVDLIDHARINVPCLE
jgi:hypothetical protein